MSGVYGRPLPEAVSTVLGKEVCERLTTIVELLYFFEQTPPSDSSHHRIDAAQHLTTIVELYSLCMDWYYRISLIIYFIANARQLCHAVVSYP